jgi:hypothetical protein
MGMAGFQSERTSTCWAAGLGGKRAVRREFLFRRPGSAVLAGIHVAVFFLAASTLPRVVLAAGGQVVLTVVDADTGKPIPARMHLKNVHGRPPKVPPNIPFWHDHLVVPGSITLKLPVGQYRFELERGPEYVTREGHFTIENFADDVHQVELRRCVNMAEEGWYSGDLYVRRPAREMELLMLAEDLHVAQVITWWNEQGKLGSQPLPAEHLVQFDGNRYYQVRAGGWARSGTELLLFHLTVPVLLPDGPFPLWPELLAPVREHRGAWLDLTAPFWWDLPLLVAHGLVDSIEVAHSRFCRHAVVGDEGDGKPRDKNLFPDPAGHAHWTQHIYFQLLECGLRIPPSAGSGSGVGPNPVGYNRVYVHVGPRFEYAKWWENFRAGRVCVGNGPLLRPRVRGEPPGHCFRAPAGGREEFEIALTLSTRDPISYLEIIKNGKVEHSLPFEQYAKLGRLPPLVFDRSGWFLVRAVTDRPKTYRFAMTGPYHVEIGEQPRISRQAAQFFLDWVYERAKQIRIDDPERRRQLLLAHRAARDFWQALVAKANAE